MLVALTAAGTEVESPEKEDKTAAEELRDIADLMVDVEDKLRDDRHDKAVQIYGKEIEDRLEKLIKEVEVNEKKSGDKTGKKPMKDSKITSAEVPRQVIQRERMPWETKEYDNWARLSEIHRGSIIQTYNNFDNLPMRWQQRISAYFLSIIETDPESIENQARMKEVQKWTRLDRVHADYYKLEIHDGEQKVPVSETIKQWNPPMPEKK